MLRPSQMTPQQVDALFTHIQDSLLCALGDEASSIRQLAYAYWSVESRLSHDTVRPSLCLTVAPKSHVRIC